MGLLIMVAILVVALLLGVYVAAIIFYELVNKIQRLMMIIRHLKVLIQSSKMLIKKR